MPPKKVLNVGKKAPPTKLKPGQKPPRGSPSPKRKAPSPPKIRVPKPKSPFKGTKLEWLQIELGELKAPLMLNLTKDAILHIETKVSKMIEHGKVPVTNPDNPLRREEIKQQLVQARREDQIKQIKSNLES